MSGFEVIGLVLALYPLLVDGIRLCKALKSGRDVRDLIREVCEEQLVFHDWIGLLLMHNVSETELLNLLDPSSSTFGRWRDPHFHQALEKSYGYAKAHFMLITLKEIHDEMEGMKGDLLFLRRAQKDPAENRLRTVIGTWRRTREGSMLRERIIRVHKGNDSLGRVLTERRPHMMPPKLSTLASQPSFVLPRCHPRTTDLYHAIDHGFHCGCLQPHFAKFQLPQFNSQTMEISRTAGNADFEVLFSVDNTKDDAVSLVDRATSNKLIESPNDEIQSPQSMYDSWQQIDQNDPYASANSELDSSRYQLSLLDTNTSVTSSVTRSPGMNSCSVSILECVTTRSNEITDLCNIIRTSEKKASDDSVRQSIGVLQAAGSVKFDLHVKAESIPNSLNMTSLEDIFLGDCCRLTRKYRIGLALRLSAAVLQLCWTPWVRKNWSWGDFSMASKFPLDNQRMEDAKVYAAHSFLSSQLRRPNRDVSRSEAFDLLSFVRGETALIRLGCALVELAFGKKLSSMAGRSAQPFADQASLDLAMACALLESGRLREEEDKEYCDVVNACLKQQLRNNDGVSFRPLTRENASFHEDATQAIVLPLYRLWAKNWGAAISSGVQ